MMCGRRRAGRPKGGEGRRGAPGLLCRRADGKGRAAPRGGPGARFAPRRCRGTGARSLCVLFVPALGHSSLVHRTCSTVPGFPFCSRLLCACACWLPNNASGGVSHRHDFSACPFSPKKRSRHAPTARQAQPGALRARRSARHSWRTPWPAPWAPYRLPLSCRFLLLVFALPCPALVSPLPRQARGAEARRAA